MEKTLNSAEELKEEAGRFAAALAPNGERATLVTLSGDLGAGKTTFAQGAAAALGITEPVTSPTFVIAKEYPLSGQEFARLVHIDAYRLKGAEELSQIRFSELMQDPTALVLLEWPEIVAEGIPMPTARITLSTLPEGGRRISYA